MYAIRKGILGLVFSQNTEGIESVELFLTYADAKYMLDLAYKAGEAQIVQLTTQVEKEFNS